MREWKHEDNLFLWSVEAIASRRKPRPTKHWNILKYKFENDEKIYINGKVLKEKYPFEIMHSAGRAVNEIQLAEDEYFVLSDNRNDMDDSRNTSFTKVRKKNIIGRVILRLNPFSLLGGPEQEEPKKEE